MKIDEQNFTSYVTSIVFGKVLCVYMYDLFDGIVCGIIQVTENNTQNHTFHWNDNSYKYLLTSSNTLLTTVNVPFNFPLVLLYTYDSHWDPDSVLFFVYIFFDVSFPSCLHVISNNSYCCYVLVSCWYRVVNLCKYYHYLNIHNLNPVVYYLESRNNLDKIKLLFFLLNMMLSWFQISDWSHGFEGGNKARAHNLFANMDKRLRNENKLKLNWVF